MHSTRNINKQQEVHRLKYNGCCHHWPKKKVKKNKPSTDNASYTPWTWNCMTQTNWWLVNAVHRCQDCPYYLFTIVWYIYTSGFHTFLFTVHYPMHWVPWHTNVSWQPCESLGLARAQLVFASYHCKAILPVFWLVLRLIFSFMHDICVIVLILIFKKS